MLTEYIAYINGGKESTNKFLKEVEVINEFNKPELIDGLFDELDENFTGISDLGGFEPNFVKDVFKRASEGLNISIVLFLSKYMGVDEETLFCDKFLIRNGKVIESVLIDPKSFDATSPGFDESQFYSLT